MTAFNTVAEELLAKDKITLEDVTSRFAKGDRTRFVNMLVDKYNRLKGVARDEFYIKAEDIFSIAIDKGKVWEYNHNKITWAISALTREWGRMPTIYEIENKSELSSQTIRKHLKEYNKDERYLETIEQFKFMTSKVLAMVFKFAVNGDMRAAKLYLETVGDIGNDRSLIHNTQNNYIQINQFKLSQETIQQLTPDQIKQVETVLQEVVHKQSQNYCSR
jgi:predicted transcriptional regulator